MREILRATDGIIAKGGQEDEVIAKEDGVREGSKSHI